MLAGTQDSAEFVKEYCRLRRSGAPIDQALVLAYWRASRYSGCLKLNPWPKIGFAMTEL